MNTPAVSGLLQVEAAIEQMLSVCQLRVGSERITVREALGRVLAKSVRAPVQVPGFDNSAVDGFAFDSAQAAGPLRLKAGVIQRAGDPPQQLAAGEAIRILTGAPIPHGCDTVVMQEDVTLENGALGLPPDWQPGSNIRPAGQDVQKGAVLITEGSPLGAIEIGLLASVGLLEVEVRKPLRVGILSSGNELIAGGRDLLPGQIYDSNGPLLHALLTQCHYQPLDPEHVVDDYSATLKKLDSLAQRADLILTTGGASVGDEDHLQKALRHAGQLKFWRLRMKPGKPLAFGHYRNTPVLVLPGNPAAVLVGFLIIARPLLAECEGRRYQAPHATPLPADFEITRAGKRREYLRVKTEIREDGPTLVAHPRQSSGILSSAAWATGLAVLEANTTVQRGGLMPYLSFSQLMEA